MGAYLKSIRNLGTKGGWGIVAVVVVAIALLLTSFPAMADDPLTSRPHEWNARQNFWKAVNFKKGSEVDFNSNPTKAIAYLGGTTGMVKWSTTAGSIGWTLTTDHLKQYSTFLVDIGGNGGASAYTHACPIGIGRSGATVIMPMIDTTLHGKTWTFANVSGTTAFVLYSKQGKFRTAGLFSGTTESPITATVRAPEDIGDTVTIMAVGTPSSVSGFYLMGVKNYD